MIALSIRQPWAWLIINGGKDIENRDWKTPFRGRCLIHASKSGTKREYQEVIAFLLYQGLDRLAAAVPPFDQIEKGGIVGSVEITGCTKQSDSPWFFGEYGFLLSNPTPLQFMPFKGRLGFFDIPEYAA